MKSIKVLGVAAVIIILIVIGFTMSQPSKGVVEKSTVILAPDSVVFNKLNTLRDFITWSPWAKMDIDAKYSYEGPAEGVGAKMTWSGKSIGKGSQWIIESIPFQRIKNGINFEALNGVFYSEYSITPVDGGVTVKWTYDGENKGFFGKMKWLFMKGALASQYEEGLHDLKYLIEKKTTSTDSIN
jgi:hypothetical protein